MIFAMTFTGDFTKPINKMIALVWGLRTGEVVACYDNDYKIERAELRHA